MENLALVGLRVLRGPDWAGGDEDGGEGHLGTVKEVLRNWHVRVLWDTGQESICKAGAEGKTELRIFDTAAVGKNRENSFSDRRQFLAGFHCSYEFYVPVYI